MYDYHTHSFFSDDSTTPLRTMIQAAIQKGIREYAVTDHYDPDYPDRSFPFEIDFPSYHRALLDAETEFGHRIKVIKGIEIGIQHGETHRKCAEAIAAFPYDFVIGSFHAAGGEDLFGSYFDHRTPEEGVREFYEYVYSGIRNFSDFDVLGHFNVIDRYVERIPDYSPYMMIIEAILQELIDKGKGIEFNTSSFRYNMGDRTTPSSEILSLYKNLGGKIVTVGSDAHRSDHVGFMFREALDILHHHGFKYITAYENRTPKFISIKQLR